MTKRINDIAAARVAVAASGGAALPLVATAIDATGFSRARFVFSFGNTIANTGSLSTGLGVWQAATSGGTYALIAGGSAAAVTSGAISSASGGIIILLDVPTSAGTPWLKMSGSFTSTAVAHSAICELYSGISRPPSSSANQVVLV